MKRLALFSILMTFAGICTLQAQDYELVWSDEFDNNTLSSNWNVETVWAPSNGELQYYRTNNVTVENGNLVITARKETYGDKSFTSGRLNSQSKVKFQYGKIVARIKMPLTANGLWPAFWMLGYDFRGDEGGDIYTSDYVGTVTWPTCGEIDIMESGNAGGINAGTQDRYFSGALHAPGGFDPSTAYTSSSAVQGDYHLFTCVWNEDGIYFYLDNATTPYFSSSITNNEYMNKPYHLLFNLAVGGNNGFTGCSTVESITALSNSGDEAKMYVDYIRVYQKTGEGSLTLATGTENDKLTADTSTDDGTSDGPNTTADIPAAPTPTRASALVQSVYSDAYTSIAPNLFVGAWNQATVTTQVKCTGNNAWQLTNFNYMGLQLTTDNSTIDVSGKDYLHIDIYPLTSMSVNIYPIALNPTDDSHYVTKQLTANQWNSFDISLDDFSSLDFSRLGQFKFDNGSGQTLYIDNIYFWSATADETAPVINTATATATTATTATLSLRATDDSGGTITYTVKNGSTTLGTTTGASGTTISYTVTGLTASTNYTLTVVAADPSGNEASTTVNCTTAAPSAVSAAPLPRHAAANVASVFSDVYTSRTLNTPDWAPQYYQTVGYDATETMDTDDEAYHYTNYNFAAYTFAALDITGMEYIHLDVYSVDLDNITVHLQGDNDGGMWVSTALTRGQWNQIDIPLSSFTGLGSRTEIDQLKFTGQNGADASQKELYLDNVYFWKPETAALTATTATNGIQTLTGRWSDSGFATIDNTKKALSYDLTAVDFTTTAGAAITPASVSPQQTNCFFITQHGKMGFGTLNRNELRKDASGYTAFSPVRIYQTAGNTPTVNTAVAPITVTEGAHYYRTSSSGGVYITGVSPFDVAESTALKAYGLSSATTTEGSMTILFTEVSASQMKAGVPYILFVESTGADMHLASALSGTVTFTPQNKTFSGGAFKSTFDNFATTASDLIYTMPKLFTEDETLVFNHYVGSYMPAFRSYLQLSSSSGAKLNIFIDEPSGISRPVGDDALPALFNVYSIDGRQILRGGHELIQLPPGIYVVNGKKVVVK